MRGVYHAISNRDDEQKAPEELIGDFSPSFQQIGINFEFTIRRAVLEHNRAILEQGRYTIQGESATLLQEPALPHSFSGMSGSIAFHYTRMEVHFMGHDAIDTTTFLRNDKGLNPVLVVSCHPTLVGNGLSGFDKSLEEELFCRTNVLGAFKASTSYDIPEQGGIYLPLVSVFRPKIQTSGSLLLPEPKQMSVILASSLSRPKYVTNHEGGGFRLARSADAKLLRMKIEAILQQAVLQGHDSIVFSAFGCGFNGTPPECVARTFRDLLEGPYHGCFEHVVFAIVEDEFSGRLHNPEGNWKPFRDAFSNSKRRNETNKCIIC